QYGQSSDAAASGSACLAATKHLLQGMRLTEHHLRAQHVLDGLVAGLLRVLVSLVPPEKRGRMRSMRSQAGLLDSQQPFLLNDLLNRHYLYTSQRRNATQLRHFYVLQINYSLPF
ncbi:hypothetical protein PENTCL1PPCAC_9210, partial [Pristionchus entomophagus]